MYANLALNLYVLTINLLHYILMYVVLLVLCFVFLKIFSPFHSSIVVKGS